MRVYFYDSEEDYINFVITYIRFPEDEQRNIEEALKARKYLKDKV